MSSSVEKGNGSLDPGERPAAGSQPKACTACNTTKTPLWRGGPSGPMSLCNACGIRYRKKRREAMGLEDPPKKRQPAAAAPAAAAACSEAGGESADPEQQQPQQPKKKTTTTKRGREVELRVVGFGKEVVLKQRRRMRRRPRLGEEEKAAILLMALSSGVIYG
ncbi:hypothetical protein CFC21_080675 [Triticum aestivum]|uniref:GATA-type domain-containing protein n=3 Tax=Triticinae TaxID=1648030 RepID=A0A453MBV3_AEGTS|nr:GATA transcription factor 15 [Aegilops tauschii subsp. strangulata]XP_044400069.1 GATA transcription factor 15-like [Triticum aestivum]KAF7075949.1 hypothetical protein CFC21_080675 [Triticum aestivum]